jgi:hypothetical protein
MHHGAAMTHDTSESDAQVGSLVFVALMLWFSLVFGLGVAGHLEGLPRPLVPITLVGSTTAAWLLSRRITAISRWMHRLDVRALVGLHVVRWPIGIWFLVAGRTGTMPGELARLAGWGDIATGALALLVLAVDARTAWGRRALLAFNTIGLVDILAVVVTAQRQLLFGDTAALRVGHPFVVLPMFVVPLVIVAHAWTFVRLGSATALPARRPTDVLPA